MDLTFAGRDASVHSYERRNRVSRMSTRTNDRISRKKFLRAGALAGTIGLLGCSGRADFDSRVKAVTIGMVADPQYADKAPWGNRHYRDAAAKLEAFVERMNEASPDFVIMLGDLLDHREAIEDERDDLRRIEGIYATCGSRRYYVLGNHDVDTFTKQQFIAATGMRAPHYSFDAGPLHFVVLDADYTKDFIPYRPGNFVWTDTWIPPAQQKWLAADLATTTRPTVAFCHQRLDAERDSHGVKNGQVVRRILEASGKVIAVFQGHYHAGAYRQIHGIHYVTLCGMVEGPGLENNAYSLVTISPDRRIRIRGFGKQPSRTLSAGRRGL